MSQTTQNFTWKKRLKATSGNSGWRKIEILKFEYSFVCQILFYQNFLIIFDKFPFNRDQKVRQVGRREGRVDLDRRKDKQRVTRVT